MDKLLDPGTLTIIFLFGSPILAVIAYYWYSIEKFKSDNDLKRRMVEAGLSVDEIERVLNAGAKGKGDK